tara:strand:- start:166 stop:768 length:603 start_codon:yes stop_codon:yes gene_type:complete
MSPTAQIDPPPRIGRSLFVDGTHPLDSIEVFAIACMAACGISEREIYERFNIPREELRFFLSPNTSMLGDSWGEHIITTYMEACKKEKEIDRALSRFNKSAKIIIGWYDCCGSMLDLYADLEPSAPLPDLGSFSSLLIRYCANGTVYEILNKEAAEQVEESATTFAVACKYLRHLIEQGTQDDTAIVGQLKATSLPLAKI